jgi:hypothetical protein
MGIEMGVGTDSGAGRANEVAVRKISGVGEAVEAAKPAAERLQASESAPRKDRNRRGLSMNLTVQALYPIDYSFGCTLNKRLYRTISRVYYNTRITPKTISTTRLRIRTPQVV